jgi:TonB family protein
MSALADTTMDDSLIYRKSGLGAALLATDHGRTLSPRERQVLILVNGHRTIAELADLLGADTVQRLIPDLEARGFAKRVDPSLDPDWARAVTQFRLPDAEPRRPASALSAPRYPMVWIALLAILVGLGTNLALHRFQSQLESNWRFDPVPAQALSIDGQSPTKSTAAIDPKRPERPAPADITPIAHRPAGVALQVAAVSPERVVPPAGTHARQAIAASPSASLSAVLAADRRTPVQSTDAQSTPVQPTAVPSTPVQSTPMQSSAVQSTPVQSTAVQSSPVQPSLAAAKPSTPVQAAQSPPAAADSPSPVQAADAPASATGNAVAVEASAAQAAGDPVKLRPLRHDPPQLPPQVLRDGIAEGHVRARLWVTPEGKVDQVDVIEATPPRVLDDEVRRALSLWTYDPPGQSAEDVVELTVKR